MSLLTFGRSDPRWLVIILVLSALAAAATSLLAWLLLPLFAFGGSHPFESEASRLIVIMVIVFGWGALNALLRARQNSVNQARLDALDRQELEKTVEVDVAKQAAESEFAEIRTNAEHALRLARGRRLTDILLRRERFLPRYLVIGPAGAGKTTILGSANLTLPYDPYETDRAAPPTCRFLVSEGAIFIDVAGEVALGGAEDRARLWRRLLGLLARLRRLKPIDGVIVVVSVFDLSSANEEARADLARILRQRLNEVSQRLRTRVPIYLLLSKLDRIRGFVEFSEHLGSEERTQVWGVPVAIADGSSAPSFGRAAFVDGFDELVHRASERQLALLNAEPDEARRIQAFEFPSQLAALRDQLAGFLDELLQRSRFDDTPMLRGAFLSCALQDGTSGDAIGNILAPTFALKHSGAPGRAGGVGRERMRRRPYFLKRLFSDVILAEAGAGGPTERARRAGHLLGYAVQGAVALLLLFGLAQTLSSYHRVGAYISDVMAASDQFHEQTAGLDVPIRTADFTPKLTLLNDLARIEAAARQPVSSSFRVVETIRSAAQTHYRQGLHDVLLPSTLRALEALMSNPTTSAADCFEALKIYLLLGSGRPPSEDAMRELGPKLADVFTGLGKDATSRAELVDHLAALSKSPIPLHDLNQRLVAQTRRRLNGITVAQIGYELMRGEPRFTGLKPWRPIDHAGSLGPRALARQSGKLLSSGVPGLFTAIAIEDVGAASSNISASLASDAWVLASEGGEHPNLAKRAIQVGVLNLYQADYVRAWEEFLSDLTIPPLPTAAAGADVIAILNGQDSPLLQLLGAALDETILDKRVEDRFLQGAKPMNAKLASLGTPSLYGEVGPLTSATRKAISGQFVGLRDALARPKEGQASEVEVILKSFDPLYKQLLLVAAGTAAPDTEPSPTNTALTMAAISRLPVTIRPYFLRLAGDGLSLLRVNLRGQAAQLWADSIRPTCETTISKAFPFDLAAQADVPIGEFTRLFSPNGMIATFRRTQLASLVDTTVRPWRWRDSHASPSDPPDPTLTMFERADAITAAFFADGDRPSVRFTVTPLQLDNTITRFQFDIGGSSLIYAHGPVEPFIGQWPPLIADAPSTLSVQPEIDGAANSIVGLGSWGLFRLIAQASKTAQKPDAMLFAFNMGKRYARLKIATPTLNTPFDLRLTAGFNCPAF